MSETELKKDDLNSGAVLDVWLFGAWRTARAEYSHKLKEYYLYLFDDVDNECVGTLMITDNLKMRCPQP
jgi:hypothetical protein